MGSGPKSLFARCDRNIVWLAGKQGPQADEWQAYTKDVFELGSTLPGKQIAILVVTDGGGPSTVQRTDFVEAMGEVKVRTAVLSCSTLVRGIVTVFNWFNVQNKVFAPKDVIGAFEFAQIPTVGRGAVWSTVESMAKLLGGLDTVEAARPFIRKSNVEQTLAR